MRVKDDNMSTTESALPATPAVETTPTPELDADSLLDTQLSELFKTFGDAEATPEVAATAKATPEATAPDDATELLDMTALETLDTPEAIKPGTAGTPPESDPFIEKLKAAIPNDVALEYAENAYQQQTKFEEAVKAGQLADAIAAMPSAGKLFQAGLAQMMANPDFEKQVVENYIRKHSPENQNPQVNALKSEVESLKQRFQTEDQKAAERQRLDAQQRQVETSKAAVSAIDAEVNSLFDRVRFTKNETDRQIVSAMFKVKLAETPDAMNKALKGDLTALRPIFKDVTTKFATNEKAKAARVGPSPKTAAPILTGAGVASETPLKGMDSAYAAAAQYIKSLQST